MEGINIPARAILDSGLQISLITCKLVKKNVSYPAFKQNLSITGVSGSINCTESIQIEIITNVEHFQILCSISNRISSKFSQFRIKKQKREIPENIVLVDSFLIRHFATNYCQRRIMLLNGIFQADISLKFPTQSLKLDVFSCTK